MDLVVVWLVQYKIFHKINIVVIKTVVDVISMDILMNVNHVDWIGQDYILNK